MPHHHPMSEAEVRAEFERIKGFVGVSEHINDSPEASHVRLGVLTWCVAFSAVTGMAVDSLRLSFTCMRIWEQSPPIGWQPALGTLGL